MASYKNFSKKRRAIQDGLYDDMSSAQSYHPINIQPIEYEEWVKFLSYSRYYIDRFTTEVLDLKLYIY